MIRNTNEAKDTLKNYEKRLRDVNKVPADEKELEKHWKMLKVCPFGGLVLGAAYCSRFQSGDAALLSDSQC